MNNSQDDGAERAAPVEPIDDVAVECDECTSHGCAVLLYLFLLAVALVVGAVALIARLVKSL